MPGRRATIPAAWSRHLPTATWRSRTTDIDYTLYQQLMCPNDNAANGGNGGTVLFGTPNG